MVPYCVSSKGRCKVEHQNTDPKGDQAHLFLRGLHQKGQPHAWKTVVLCRWWSIGEGEKQLISPFSLQQLTALSNFQSHSQLCFPHYGNGPTRALPSWLTLGINTAGTLTGPDPEDQNVVSSPVCQSVFSLDLSPASFTLIFYLIVPRHTYRA